MRILIALAAFVTLAGLVAQIHSQDPAGQAFDEAFMLVTHAPFMAVGLAVLVYRVARRHPSPNAPAAH